jgi:hypothetical protein
MVNDVISHVKGFMPFSDCLCILILEGNLWDILVVNCYASTEEDNNDIKSEFYEKLERIYNIQIQKLHKNTNRRFQRSNRK